MSLFQTLALFFAFTSSAFGTRDAPSKRFLIDGTDASGSRLSHLESNQQVLTLMMNRLNNTLIELMSRNTLQDNLIHQLQNTITQLQTDNIRQQGTITSLQTALSHLNEVPTTVTTPPTKVSEYGSTYIRWGKRHCPADNVDEVYSGYGGGQYYNTGKGGPAGMLCLPDNPEVNTTLSTTSDSHIYGMEYQDDRFKTGAVDEDVPCVLCNSKSSHTSVMIPGRKTCYSSWKREYYGLLASGSTGHASSNYICVDINPDYTPGGQDDKDGKLIYVSSIVCGSMPCPPYKAYIPLYCVVCSK